MQLIRGLQRWPDTHGTVVTIGNFDGVHLGHQAMFNAVLDMAKHHAMPATVVSFEPLPHEYFNEPAPPARLQGLRDRFDSIKSAGMDRLLLLQFDHSLASQSADDFISDTLVHQLRVKHMVIGDDFRFGHKRIGTIDLLSQGAGMHGYTLEQSPTCVHDGARVSSTRIRAHLRDGQLDQAAALLGRAYRISGRVIHGEKMGRQLGFPTANVALGTHKPPLRGVFAVWAHDTRGGQRYAAVANLGERPTIGGRKLLLEVHALDAHVDWYGHHLSVDFIKQLRQEKRFDSLDALKQQITRDADEARALIARI